MTIYSYALSLGSNLGERRQNLQSAVVLLRDIDQNLCISPIYETAPMYVSDQPMFLNLAVTLQSLLEPIALLRHVKSLEQEIGRVDGLRHGPRIVDIDIILCGDLILSCDELAVPHNAFHERDFVLRPLAEIAGQWIDPKSGKTVAELANRVLSDTVRLHQEDII